MPLLSAFSNRQDCDFETEPHPFRKFYLRGHNSLEVDKQNRKTESFSGLYLKFSLLPESVDMICSLRYSLESYSNKISLRYLTSHGQQLQLSLGELLLQPPSPLDVLNRLTKLTNRSFLEILQLTLRLCSTCNQNKSKGISAEVINKKNISWLEFSYFE